MLTLATAYFVKVVLNTPSNTQGEFYPIAMWLIALCADFALLIVAMVRFSG